jgi:hydrogenase nickel incorporation protein HypA/HybF
MHEWALAESVIHTVGQEAEKNHLKKIERVVVNVGELQQIDMEIFRFALDTVLGSYNLELDPANILLQIEKSLLKCRVCGNEWSFSDTMEKIQNDEAESIHFVPEVAHIFMRCTACGSPDFDIIVGRGIWIESIEGE